MKCNGCKNEFIKINHVLEIHAYNVMVDNYKEHDDYIVRVCDDCYNKLHSNLLKGRKITHS